ncbi:hypothetical protein ABZZ79_12395 [Streptomyces sp. NPDC006458]|uniref:hypothetical protein n=1 Tax=Streptomyces sp. NPDC006458 TaxID=3154302 RepID=UPI00339F913A
MKGDPADLRLLERLHTITARHTESLRGALLQLRTEDLVPSVDVRIRRVPLAPAFKLYLFNGDEALHGPYEVIERPLAMGEDVVTALDVLGLGATLTHHVKDEDRDSPGSVFVESMRSWFESVWTLLADED